MGGKRLDLPCPNLLYSRAYRAAETRFLLFLTKQTLVLKKPGRLANQEDLSCPFLDCTIAGENTWAYPDASFSDMT